MELPNFIRKSNKKQSAGKFIRENLKVEVEKEVFLGIKRGSA